MQRRDRPKAVQGRVLRVVPAVADDENTRTTSSNYRVHSEQNPKRVEVTSKRFEEVSLGVRTRNFRGLFD